MGLLLRGTLAVESSLLTAVADKTSDHWVAGAPLELVDELAWWTGTTLTARPDLNGASATDDRVQGEREHDLGLVVDLALDLPLADVLISTFACVLNQHEFAVWRDLFNTNWAFIDLDKRQEFRIRPHFTPRYTTYTDILYN